MALFNNLTPESAQLAISGREALLQGGCLSRPANEPKIAVVTSLVDNLGQISPDQAAEMTLERQAIISRLVSRGVNVVDIDEPSVEDMDALILDPTITDLCLIGEGAIGSLYVRRVGTFGKRTDCYDWLDVSKTADHLKTGNIYQRMCSVVSISPVIWGTFASANLPKIWISEDEYFAPDEVHIEPDQGLVTVYEENTVTYESLVKMANSLKSRKVTLSSQMA